MRIDPKGTIAGHPSLKIRELLRYGAGHPWSPSFVSERLGLSAVEAQRVLDQLSEDGYIEPDNTHSHQVYWRNTLKGNALALASAAKPVRRSTAEKKVSEFLDRVRHINEDPHYLYKVTKVLVFGSYLTDKDKLNDVDLAVELKPKHNDRDEQQRYEKDRTQVALSEGRSFDTFIAGLLWPKQETLLFLKSRSRTISLHETSDPILKQVEYRVLFALDDSVGECPTSTPS